MIRLNPVTDVDESVQRGLVAIKLGLGRLDDMLTTEEFKELLISDPTTEEGEIKVAEFFKALPKWETLTNKWNDEKKIVHGFRRYYELLFLVKSQSKHDRVWFSFFEGMHRHAAVVTGMLCSKLDNFTNELEPGSLTLDHFKNEDVVKSFSSPGVTVEEQLNNIMTKQIEAPMFNNSFVIHGYIPTISDPTRNAGQLIEGARLQSQWISRFKLSLARVSLSKNIANWLKTIQTHSTGHTRNNPKFRPDLSRQETPVIVLQTDTKVSAFRKAMEKSGRDDDCHVYDIPSVIRSETWNAYIRSPFEGVARRAFVKTITFPCIDDTKQSEMTPPYRITYESVTTDLGTVATKNCARKVDVRLYNAYLIIPGIVLHLSSKAKSVEISKILGGDFEVNVINFVARYGNYTRKSPFLTIHGAYTKYIEVMTDVTYITGLTGDSQIVPVTMFLVMLYNACFMFQKNNETNLLTTALDTLDLNADVDHEKFMSTMSEYNNLRTIPFRKNSF